MEENNKYDAEEQKEVAKVALLLYSWKFLKLDPIEAQALEKQKEDSKKQILGRIEIQNHHHQPMSPEIGQPNNNGPGGDNNDRAISPPRLPPVLALNGLIGECSRPFEKQLTESDVKDDQSRLSLNKDFVINYFLPILNDGEDPEEEITVTTYDIEGKEYKEMVFKLWGKKMYVLTRNWKKFCHHHNFVKHSDWVTVWMFRHNQTNKLCFVITSRHVPVDAESSKRKFKSANRSESGRKKYRKI